MVKYAIRMRVYEFALKLIDMNVLKFQDKHLLFISHDVKCCREKLKLYAVLEKVLE